MDPKELVVEMIRKLSETDPNAAVAAATGFYIINSVDEKLTTLLTLIAAKAAEDTALRQAREIREAEAHDAEMRRLKTAAKRDEERHEHLLEALEDEERDELEFLEKSLESRTA